jgi:hypothetical protein
VNLLNFLRDNIGILEQLVYITREAMHAICNVFLFTYPELKQYVASFKHKQQGSLRSPKIVASKACLTFQYMSNSWWSLDDSRMFVYVKDAESKQLLPVNDKLLYYGHSKWNTIKIDLNIENGFTQVGYGLCPVGIQCISLSKSRVLIQILISS